MTSSSLRAGGGYEDRGFEGAWVTWRRGIDGEEVGYKGEWQMGNEI